MQNQNIIHVEFTVFDFGDDPSAVTEIMKIEPTKSWIKGEYYSEQNPQARRTHSRWTLSSGLDSSESFENQINSLLLLLEPKQNEILQINKLFTAKILVAQYLYETTSDFIIEPDILKRLNNLSLLIHFDLYSLATENN